MVASHLASRKLAFTKFLTLRRNDASHKDHRGSCNSNRPGRVNSSYHPLSLPPPPASATSDKGSSVTQSAALRPDTNKTKIDADCRKAIINDLKLRAAIVDALIKAGLSAADAAALAPRIAAEMATEGPLSSTTTI
ncbi:hypothetical protein KB1_20730 [Cutibacterium modestum]|uniref:Uncharacterized protein n=1 Tax=Cutibacterium modestum TaxID=2559073 RepID=A0AAD1KQ55_9ACTN|nr:hypothetical protein KB1_20730 [Cutibacterium modestum]